MTVGQLMAELGRYPDWYPVQLAAVAGCDDCEGWDAGEVESVRLAEDPARGLAVEVS